MLVVVIVDNWCHVFAGVVVVASAAAASGVGVGGLMHGRYRERKLLYCLPSLRR